MPSYTFYNSKTKKEYDDMMTIAEMEETAEKRGGVCLSKIYVNAKTKLEWKCELGHVWEATPDSIRNKNSWCPICSTQKKR